jgi:putative membrane protein
MQPPNFPDDEYYDVKNELAKERTGAAIDRTLMAWIRTSLSLIGFGFGIPTIVRTIESTRIGKHLDPHFFSNVIGLSFIGIGMYAMSVALMEHRRILKNIKNNCYVYESSKTAQQVGLALILVGLVSFLGVLIKGIAFIK